MNLDPLFCPRTVALIGASRTSGKVGYEILSNLIQGGFGGEIIPVNPLADELLGLRCYKDVLDYDGTIDLSVIVLPVSKVLEGVEHSIRMGAQAIIVITAGFKEVGPEGAELEKKVADVCRARQVRLLGPNCLGLINTAYHLNASFAQQMPGRGSISVISQSGALCTAILDWSIGRHLGLAKLVSIGNKADLSENDFLPALAEDSDTSVIVVYLESIESGGEFVKAAEAAASKKPVVVLKSAVTEAGRKAASSHTGSLAGADIAYGAAFRRCGLIRADDFESLLDYATALAMQPTPRGDRVAIITNAGGPGIMAADAVLQEGLQVADLGRDTVTALRQKLPSAASVANPIDVLGDGGPERYVAALEAAQDDPAVDAVMVILAPQAMTHPRDIALAIAGAVRGDKTVLAVFMGGQNVIPGREQLAAANLPDFGSPKRAVSALKAMHQYGEWRRRPERVIARLPVNRRRVERVIARHYRCGRVHIGEADAKEILKAYAFSVPEGCVAGDAGEAVDAANRLGFPVALKLVSPNVIHKSDLGGVKLNLATAEAVQDAYDLMMLRTAQRAPEAQVEGVYVEKMCGPGMEVILGMSRDPQFGPMLMFGLGGIFVEILKDVSFHLAPVSTGEAMQMLAGTRSFALLKGARGQAEANIEGIAGCLQRLSQLAMDFPAITELDINPLLVGAGSIEPVVLDARMTLKEDDHARSA